MISQSAVFCQAAGTGQRRTTLAGNLRNVVGSGLAGQEIGRPLYECVFNDFHHCPSIRGLLNR